MKLACVAIDVPIKRPFTYKIPEGMDGVVAGSRVLVPFRNKTVVGIVVDVQVDVIPTNVVPTFRSGMFNSPFLPVGTTLPTKLKEILALPDEEPVFSSKMLQFVNWISDYYCAPIGEVCRAALPTSFAKNLKNKRKEKVYKETLVDDVFLSAPLHNLIKSQSDAYNNLKSQISNLKFQTTLLHGVTGSGKTEVYLRLFADVLKMGKEAIFLVPEIGLTPQAVGRLTARFGDLVATYHSSLGDARRLYEWRRMQSSSAKIVIGTRSAVFAPFKNLGLIVVDEEHDASYKQEESTRYNGRDASVMRAKIENVPCLLGSATPSMESFNNSKLKKYHYIHLPDRPTGAEMPEVETVDMRSVQKSAFLSPQLINAISATLFKKEQVILFLNKRGFASFVLCTDCGHTYTCPNCNITLTLHKHNRSLLCHYCDYEISAPSSCMKCKSSNVKPLGMGTERIEAEIRSYFSTARVARFDRDSVAKAGERQKILSKMKTGEIDILIGTQMITKGHDFPNVTLVGVIDADMSLNFPDFRAPERTFQLITQVAGRSGRADASGKVIVQTYSPEHYAISSASRHDFFEFYNEEVSKRQELSYPPFGKLALIRVQGLKEVEVQKFAEKLADQLMTKSQQMATILGPSPAPLAKVRNKFRWHIMIKSNNINKIKQVLAVMDDKRLAVPPGIKVIIDVDPVSML